MKGKFKEKIEHWDKNASNDDLAYIEHDTLELLYKLFDEAKKELKELIEKYQWQDNVNGVRESNAHLKAFNEWYEKWFGD